MTPKTSPFSRAWRPFAAGPACTSARPARGAFTTWSTRSSTTASTRPSRGYCDHIVVTLLPDGRVSVSDNGRGIPVAAMADTGVPALEVVLTKLHAGGKFGGDGLQGVRRPARRRHLGRERAVRASAGRGAPRRPRLAQEYERGEPLGPLEQCEAVDRDRHHHHLPARCRDLRGDRLLVRHAGPAAPRDGVPDQGPAGSS